MITAQPDARSWRDEQWRIVGNWEPLMFLRRRGDGAFTDLDRVWQDIHSDEAIARMVRLGLNGSHIHFHKGYGLEREAASIAEAKAWAEKLHAAGLRVGVYIGTTFFFEVFRHPDYERMVVVNDQSGWGGGQYYRKHWCYNSPEAFTYFHEVIRVAIREVRADTLHFDVGFCTTLADLCHCRHCLEGFRRFVREEAPETIAAAGYDSADELLPPPNGSAANLAGIASVKDPVVAAWLRFHAQAGYRALRRFSECSRSLSPDVAIFYNGANLCGITPFSRPNRELDALALVDAGCVEDSLENPVGIAGDGMPVSRFRAYKGGAQYGTRVLCYTTEEKRNGALMLAESAAFGCRTLGIVETAMQTNHRLAVPADLAMFDYLVKHESLFMDREPWHNIAVLRHHESMLLNPWPGALSPYVVEQALFERHMPLALLSNAKLCAEGLQPFDLLILPDAKCLDDREADAIARFVERGGRLLSIGPTGTATLLNQFRSRWALAEIFGTDACPTPTSSSYQETAVSALTSEATPSSATDLRVAFGRGQAVHLRGLDFQVPNKAGLSRFAGLDWYYHPYWKPPRNLKALLEAVDSLLEGRRRVATDLPRHVGVEFYRVAGGYRLCLVNYAHPQPVPPCRLRLAGMPAAPTQTRWQTPETEAPLAVKALADGSLEWSIPSFNLLGTITLNCPGRD